MYQRSEVSPVPGSFLHEALVECFDALMHPFDWDGGREAHTEALNDCLGAEELPDDLRPLLGRTLEQFQSGPVHVLDRDADQPSKELAVELAAWMDAAGLPRFIYHGTIYGRLKDIAKDGLVPGAKPVWKERFASREHCDGAVFFELTWRGGWNWATIAHQSSRGKRDGQHRAPVVIRTPMADLRLERDPLATSDNSVMVRSAVALDDASVFVGDGPGYPTWRSLAELVSE